MNPTVCACVSKHTIELKTESSSLLSIPNWMYLKWYRRFNNHISTATATICVSFNRMNYSLVICSEMKRLKLLEYKKLSTLTHTQIISSAMRRKAIPFATNNRHVYRKIWLWWCAPYYSNIIGYMLFAI